MFPQANLLVENLIKGDREAFTQLFKDFYKGLCVNAYRIVGELNDAEEVVQNVFVKIWEKRNELEHIDNIESYLRRSVYNASISFYRRKKLESNYKDLVVIEKAHSYEPFDETINRNDEIERLEKAIENLPARSKEIFLMSRYELLSYKEIAEKTGITPKGVEFHIVKAFKLLRSQMLNYKILIICFLWIK